MPLIRSMLQAMKRKYGNKKGKKVYFGYENKLRSKKAGKLQLR